MRREEGQSAFCAQSDRYSVRRDLPLTSEEMIRFLTALLRVLGDARAVSRGRVSQSARLSRLPAHGRETTSPVALLRRAALVRADAAHVAENLRARIAVEVADLTAAVVDERDGTN